MLSLLLSDEVQAIKDFWHPDWSQFWPSIIATVVGFFLAIVFQQLIYEAIKDNITNRKKAIAQIRKIHDELEEIIETLSPSIPEKDPLDPENISYIDPIKTPVWDAILNTNEIQNINDYFESKTKPHKLFKRWRKASISVDLCKELFRLYALIAEYNEWNNFRTKQKLLLNESSTEDEKDTVLTAIGAVKQCILDDPKCNIKILLKTLTDILPQKKQKGDKR